MSGHRHGQSHGDGGGILVVNAGSSSVKFALYRAGQANTPPLIGRGEIESIGAAPHLLVTDAAGSLLAERRWEVEEAAGLDRLLANLIDWVESHFGAGHLRAAGHRVALGGLEHSAPTLVTEPLVGRLRALAPLAPLHQPHNLEPIEILWKLHPALPQVACFDTAFHRTMPRIAQLYGLPRALTEAGARRYGFHGLSYEYIAGALPKIDAKTAAGRTVVAHLGSGASLCAMSGGRSVATTMGFSPLSGIPMGSRPGDVDPGILLWLMRDRKMSPEAIETMLYHDCGLAGVSGISADMRELLASTDRHAREAIDLFVYRIGREIGSLAAALGGLDALVFTGGIGEHAAPIRAAVCRQCAWLGIAVDRDANRQNGLLISEPDSRVKVWVVPTDEELMIACHTAAIALSEPAAMTS